jgi:hypothetical protein
MKTKPTMTAKEWERISAELGIPMAPPDHPMYREPPCVALFSGNLVPGIVSDSAANTARRPRGPPRRPAIRWPSPPGGILGRRELRRGAWLLEHPRRPCPCPATAVHVAQEGRAARLARPAYMILLAQRPGTAIFLVGDDAACGGGAL